MKDLRPGGQIRLRQKHQAGGAPHRRVRGRKVSLLEIS
jgi:hypothetical protein